MRGHVLYDQWVNAYDCHTDCMWFGALAFTASDQLSLCNNALKTYTVGSKANTVVKRFINLINEE